MGKRPADETNDGMFAECKASKCEASPESKSISSQDSPVSLSSSSSSSDSESDGPAPDADHDPEERPLNCDLNADDPDSEQPEKQEKRNGKHEPVSRELHCRIRMQAAAENWPDGPSNVVDLFNWPDYNSGRIFDVAPDKPALLARLSHTLSKDWEIHEAYAGTGNGACTLHWTLCSLQRECFKQSQECVLLAL